MWTSESFARRSGNRHRQKALATKSRTSVGGCIHDSNTPVGCLHKLCNPLRIVGVKHPSMFTSSIRSNRSFQCFVEIANSHDRKNRHQEFINDKGVACRNLYDDCCRIRGCTNSCSWCLMANTWTFPALGIWWPATATTCSAMPCWPSWKSRKSESRSEILFHYM